MSSARCIVDRVLSLADWKPLYQDRILIRGETHPFVEEEAEIEKSPVQFIKGVCLKNGSKYLPVVNVSSEKMMRLIRCLGHFEVTHIKSGYGWDDENASLILPNLTVSDRAVVDPEIRLDYGPFSPLVPGHGESPTEEDRKALVSFQEETPYLLAMMVALLPPLFAPAYRETDKVRTKQTVNEEFIDGEWIIVGGSGTADGARSWSYSFAAADPEITEAIGTPGVDSVWLYTTYENGYLGKRSTNGSYADTWNSTSTYDATTKEWRLTGGEMSGSGTLTSTQDIDYVHHKNEWGVTTDTTFTSKAKRTETFTLKQTVADGAWTTTQQDITVKNEYDVTETTKYKDYSYLNYTKTKKLHFEETQKPTSPGCPEEYRYEYNVDKTEFELVGNVPIDHELTIRYVLSSKPGDSSGVYSTTNHSAYTHPTTGELIEHNGYHRTTWDGTTWRTVYSAVDGERETDYHYAFTIDFLVERAYAAVSITVGEGGQFVLGGPTGGTGEPARQGPQPPAPPPKPPVVVDWDDICTPPSILGDAIRGLRAGIKGMTNGLARAGASAISLRFWKPSGPFELNEFDIHSGAGISASIAEASGSALVSALP